jgi:hypothetical protein
VKRAKAQFTGDKPSGPVIVSDRTKKLEEERLRNKEKEEKRAFKEILKNKRDPKRSVYYDEVWNPYGVPPPGMPWKERDENDSEGTAVRFFNLLTIGWSTDSDVRKIPMPRDTPPAAKKPKPPTSQQPTIRRRQSSSPQPKAVVKAPEPEIKKQGPSDTIEEAFLRAGATVIESAPVIRNFEKEAVSIVPSVIKRRPSKKPGKEARQNQPEQDLDKNDVEEPKLFATTVEDEYEETPVVVTTSVKDTSFVTETTLKRPLEKKVEVPVPPKRRRMVNAAPDV